MPVSTVSERGRAFRLRRWLCALACLSATAGVQAMDAAAPRDPCGAQALYALSEAGLLPPGDTLPIVSQACRIWPFDPTLELAAVAYPSSADDRMGERALRLVVAVLDAKDARVLSTHQIDLGEDAAFALAEDGILLDTARYDLARGIRAFGVVLRSSAPGPSCPDGRANDEMTLYVRDSERLRPVFTSHLDFWARVEGEPCSWARGQRLVTEEARFTIEVQPTVHHGFADLRVQANVTRTETVTGSDREQSSQRRDSRVLRYDGLRYDARPLQNGFFWIQDTESE
ncbi:hypothetical protein ACF3M1_07900 [Luteimonas sp. WGS1318]|uniref:hypothetical protein n=1 Tax=Luteimonas sp. WGS1318 TaxID=3366815 RepID=UPI00372D4871